MPYVSLRDRLNKGVTDKAQSATENRSEPLVSRSKHTDWRRRADMAKQREAEAVDHAQGRPRTGKPRKVAKPKRLTPCDIAVLAYLAKIAPKWSYASEMDVPGHDVQAIEQALLRLYALGVVGHRAQCKGYRPSVWCCKTRALKASPHVVSLLADHAKDVEKLPGQGDEPVNKS